MFSADLGVNQVASNPPASDPPFQKVALLLHGDGTNGAQNNTFVDNADVITPTQGYAVEFNTSNQGVMTATNSLFTLGTGDYTIEFWYYRKNTGTNNTIFRGFSGGSSTSFYVIDFNALGGLTFYSPGFSGKVTTSANNVWRHYAVCRSSGVSRVFQDGVLKATSTDTANYTEDSFYLGCVGASAGLMSNVRIVKGVALYTAAFARPSSPLTAVTGTSLLTYNSATIVDNSGNSISLAPPSGYTAPAVVSPKTITRTGNVAQGTFSPFSLAEGQWSNYFDGTGDYLSSPNDASLNVLGSSFTIECWFYLTSTSPADMGLISKYDSSGNGYILRLLSTGTGIRWYADNGGGSYLIIDRTYTFSLNTWYHVAVTCDGTNTAVFVNGVKQGASGGVASANSTATLQVGLTHTSTNYFTGYISNVRVVKGTDVYGVGNSSFTVPTTPLTAITNTSLLTCQSNRFKDNSSNNFTITRNGDTKVTAFSPFAPSAAYSASTNGGSAYFDGSGDYLQYSNTAWGTGDYTTELFAYANTANGNPNFFDTRNYFSTPSGIGTYLYIFNGTIHSPLGNSSVVFPLLQWNHIALCRSGTTLRLYLNGVLIQTGSNSDNLGAYPTTIGSQQTYQYFTGYISNVRFTTSALYTGSTYTVPTSPLTAVANTQLLLNCTNAGIIDNSGKNDIETVGNAQISTSVKKYGTGSMYFDGTGDWLSLPDNPNLQLGTGDFTIECWFNLNVLSSTLGFFQGIAGKGTSSTGWEIRATTANVVSFFNNSAVQAIGTTVLTTGVWYHLAIVRSGTSTGNLKIYINGTLDATSSVANTTAYTQTNPLIVAANRAATGSALNGYIDDLRITKGQALYTSNFTPPTQAFPDV